MREPFGSRLRAAIDTRGPLCVGIDPHPALLDAWGVGDSPAGLERFCRTVAEASADLAAVVKPQSAFFERWGGRGVSVLERLVADLRETGALLLLDVKRGDLGGTMAGYAEAYLAYDSPLACDAITVSPYLGFGSLRETIATATANDAGLFVLARTANPEAAPLQDLVAGQILDGVSEANAGHAPLGPVGVVLSTPSPDGGYPLERLNGPILTPCAGRRGATPAQLARSFAPVRQAVLPVVSRAVLGDPEKVRERVTALREECVRALGPAA